MEAITLITNSSITDNYSDPTLLYVSSMIQPYVETMNAATSISQINNWVQKLFTPSSSERVNNFIRDKYHWLGALSNLDNAKREVALELVLILNQGAYNLNISDQDLTPWLISSNLTNNAQALFGSRTDKHIVTITLDNKIFDYELTEEFVVGLLSVGINVSYKNSTLDINMFNRYMTEDGFEYSADVANNHYGFNTTDFIRGVLTGCKWLNVDPHDVISNFKRSRDGMALKWRS